MSPHSMANFIVKIGQERYAMVPENIGGVDLDARYFIEKIIQRER